MPKNHGGKIFLADLKINPIDLKAILLFLSILCIDILYAQEQIQLETQTKAIRNGTLIPEDFVFNQAQINAIGWLYFDAPDNPFCTATVISDRAIITAKHCFFEDNMPNSKIANVSIFGFAIGATPSQPPLKSFSFNLSQINAHPKLDILIIDFEPNTFSIQEIEIMPINPFPLDAGLFNIYKGNSYPIGGFGETYNDTQFGRYFASVQLELISSTSIYVNGKSKMGICGGDSGALLLAPSIDGYMRAIALEFKGDPCCMGVDQLTRIDVAYAWIAEYAGLNPEIPNVDYPENCWGISRFGQCHNQTLITCQNGQYAETDCAARGLVCGQDLVEANCVIPVESCSDLGADGICSLDGSSVSRCVMNQYFVEECGFNQFCDVVEGRARCFDEQRTQLDPSEDDYVPECTSIDDLEQADALQGKMLARSSCQSTHSLYVLSLVILILMMYLKRSHQ
jgi:hypothetical protein